MDAQEQIDRLEAMGPIVNDIDDPNLDLLDPVLRPCVMMMRGGYLMVKHPWVNTMPVMVGQANTMLTAKVGMMRQYLAEKNYRAYFLVVVERPWRMSILERWWDRGKLTIEELRDLLEWNWTDTEFPSTNLDEADHLFHEAGFTTDDADGFEKLPDELTVYRGGGEEGGISWTLEYPTAEFFARRFRLKDDPAGKMWKLVVPKTAVLGYFTGRGEAEVVLSTEVWGLETQGPVRV